MAISGDASGVMGPPPGYFFGGNQHPIRDLTSPGPKTANTKQFQGAPSPATRAHTAARTFTDTRAHHHSPPCAFLTTTAGTVTNHRMHRHPPPRAPSPTAARTVTHYRSRHTSPSRAPSPTAARTVTHRRAHRYLPPQRHSPPRPLFHFHSHPNETCLQDAWADAFGAVAREGGSDALLLTLERPVQHVGKSKTAFIYFHVLTNRVPVYRAPTSEPLIFPNTLTMALTYLVPSSLKFSVPHLGASAVSR